jgi:hypothetical protein
MRCVILFPICCLGNDTIVQVLDALLLLLGDLWLRLDKGPKLGDIVSNFLDVDVANDGVATGHLFDVRLELAGSFMNDFGVDDIALGSDLSMWCSRESN